MQKAKPGNRKTFDRLDDMGGIITALTSQSLCSERPDTAAA